MDTAVGQEGSGSASDTYAYFGLTGQFYPDRISEELGLEPTVVARAGEVVRDGAVLTHKLDFWSLESTLTSASDPAAHIESLIERLRPFSRALAELTTSHEGGIFVAIYLRDAQGPFARISPAAIQWLASVNAFVDFDLYAMPADEDASHHTPERREAGTALGERTRRERPTSPW